MHNLTRGVLTKILDGATVKNAVLQILDYKKVCNGGKDRFLLLLYDGVTRFSSALLAFNLNYLIETNKLKKHSTFKLKNYAFKQLLDANSCLKIIICLDIEILIPSTEVKQEVSLLNTDKNFAQPCTSSSSESFVNSSNSNEINIFLCDSSPQNLCFTKTASLLTKLDINNSDSSKKGKLPSKSALENLSYKQNFNCHKVEEPVKLNDKLLAHCSSFLPCDTFNKSASSSTNFFKNTLSSEGDILVKKSTLQNLSYKKNCNSNKVCDDKLIFPILSLTPYHSKWTIKARIVYKTTLINYDNKQGNGKFISFVLLDETGDIRAVGFDNYAVELQSLLEINNIYYISNGSVKIAREISCVNHEYEIVLSRNSNIEQVMTDDLTVPMLSFNFIHIKQIASCPKDSFVDVIGICVKESDVEMISMRNGKEISKRCIQLVDMSGSVITVTLWGAEAENFKKSLNFVIAIKNAKVQDYGGLSLNVSPCSMFFIDPSIKEASNLKLWIKNLNDSIQFQQVSFSEFAPWKTFADVIKIDKPIYYTTKATVIQIRKEKCLYPACPLADCNRKVTILNNGLYKCDKCSKIYTAFSWQLFLPLILADFSRSLRVMAFEEKAEGMINFKSEELNKIKESNMDKYYDILSDLHFKSFIFKLCSKRVNYNGTNSLRTVITNVNIVEPLIYSKKIINDIKLLATML
ncbi:replication protein A 70 kDa DNA-binding subunit-like [Stegodyphus dumicola]|uniref:replication protein A 70 kDa DNA-binding subunit-like n=1 Tax=Stegodyphus dumicola TaxID=202533 RepID=UPI0015B315E3|nr:replication protein A 70 kDa DNA-binding subunit-like [Stegodyphus dumicola]